MAASRLPKDSANLSSEQPPNGDETEWLGTCTDVQELKELQSRQDVMLAELQHRTKPHRRYSLGLRQDPGCQLPVIVLAEASQLHIRILL
jgi:hypothetical protein